VKCTIHATKTTAKERKNGLFQLVAKMKSDEV